ncbi:MAG: hypothetical protein ONB12_06395 [candidate division KSB1 bacterium]|nr:hypothetical protein [candidate division KSB1 bacterium]
MRFKAVTMVVLLAAVALQAQLPRGVARDTKGWIPFPLTSFNEVKGTALDMSWLLEAPAGQHGFLQVRGDKFYFDDGTEARFWGGNIFGEANFGDPKEAEFLADVIARSGANIIRMHHLDVVKPWTDKIVQRSLFGGQRPPTTRVLDPKNLDRFHYMFYCLKQRGIYIFLSHNSSRFIMGGDGFPGDPEGFEDVDQGLKVEGMFDPYLIELQKEYLRALLTTVNPYTGLRLIDDPAMVMTEITNENSLLWIQPDGTYAVKSKYYRHMLGRMFAEWLKGKYGDEASLRKAWSQEGKIALFDDENFGEGHIKIPHIYVTDRDWPVSAQRAKDTYRFLVELQDKYYQEMYRFLKELGFKGVITGSNHWHNDPADLYLNAKLDFVDRHYYWTHPHHIYNYLAGQGIMAEPMVKHPRGGNIGENAVRCVYGKPFTISEWHNPLPNPYRAEGTPITAAYSCLLDWHPMQYAYWGAREAEPDTINAFEAMFDPTQFNLLPLSALMFHRRDFKSAERSWFEIMTPEQILNPRAEAPHPQVAFIGKYGVAFTDLQVPSCNDGTLIKEALQSDGVYVSSTGELRWDTKEGVVTLNSPLTQGVIGFIGGKRLETRDWIFEPATEFAVILTSSLTNERPANSSRILVSTSADARMSGLQIDEKFTLITKTGKFPFLMQPVEGKITLKTSAPIRVYRLSPGGKRAGEIKTLRTEEGVVIPLAASNKAMHYEIVR